MPEGPELYIASAFINQISKTSLFGGKVVKSEVSTKNPDVEWNQPVYRITALSRGKELKLELSCENDSKEEISMNIIFRFGMSGGFKLTTQEDLPKHAHLRFFTTNENPQMVLSFVDYRRFGRWEVNGKWGKERGADPMWDYLNFRSKIFDNLDRAVFKRPICEAMLDQKYFNGIGNYLRAEILFRCGVRPFESARDVLSELKPFSKWYQEKEKGNDIQKSKVKPDILDLCHILPKEVINLGGGKDYTVGSKSDGDYSIFQNWLQCYYVDGMNNIVDHNKRTIWFTGETGPLVPKDKKERKKIIRGKANKRTSEDDASLEKDDKKSVKKIKVEKRLNHNKKSTVIKSEKKQVNNDTSVEKDDKKSVKKIKVEKRLNHNKTSIVIKSEKKQVNNVENKDVNRRISRTLSHQKNSKKGQTLQKVTVKEEVTEDKFVPNKKDKSVSNRSSRKVIILEKETKTRREAVQFPCGKCGAGVGRNSIECTGCKKWCHKRCSGLKSLNKAGNSFRCPTCVKDFDE